MNLYNISKEYDNKKILDNVNIDFTQGLNVIIGPSGTGKTTLINIMAKYVSSDTGNIDFDKDSKLSYLFQENVLFERLTLRENFDLIKSIDAQKFKEYLELFQVSSLLDHEVSSLSGGEVKRTTLALTLAKEATIYLLDEPTSGLDKDMRVIITDILLKLSINKIVVCTSHDECLTNKCTKIIDLGRSDFGTK